MEALLGGAALRSCVGRMGVRQSVQKACRTSVPLQVKYQHATYASQIDSSNNHQSPCTGCSSLSPLQAISTNRSVLQKQLINGRSDSNVEHNSHAVNSISLCLDTRHSLDNCAAESGIVTDVIPTRSPLVRSQVANFEKIYTNQRQIDVLTMSVKRENALASNEGADKRPDPNSKPQRPPIELLRQMKAELERHLPIVLREGVPYQLFDENVVIEDGFFGRPRVKRGLNALGVMSAKYRFLVYARYTQAKLHIIRIGMDEKDSRLTIRWRLVGYTMWGKHSLMRRARKQANFLSEAATIISQRRANQTLPDEETVRKIMRQSMLSFQDPDDPDAAWVEGYFEVHVNEKGRISRFRIDRIDESRSSSKAPAPSTITKLLAALGLAPKPHALYESHQLTRP